MASTSAGPISKSAAWVVLPSRMPVRGGVFSAATLPSSRGRRRIVVVGLGWLHDVVFDPANSRQTWTELPQPSQPVGIVVTTLGTKVFMMKNDPNTTINSFACLESNRGGWRSLPPMPTECELFAATSVNDDNIVVVGGFGNPLFRKNANVFHAKTNTWTPLPDMSERRSACAATSVGNKVYVFGGISCSEGHVLRTLDTAEVLDLSLRTWERLPRMPHCREGPAAVAVGHLVLIIGGEDSNDNKLKAVDCFDTVTHQWLEGMPPLHTARTCCGAAYTKGFVHVFGGVDEHDNNLDTVELIQIDPYCVMVPKLESLFREDSLPLGLWSHILAAHPPHVVHFILLSERFHLDSVLQQQQQHNSSNQKSGRKRKAETSRNDF